jgi:hypothetical protein
LKGKDREGEGARERKIESESERKAENKTFMSFKLFLLSIVIILFF